VKFPAVTGRKKIIMSFIEQIEKMPESNPDKHTLSTYAYVLVYAGIEFMVENILREWSRSILLIHRNSKKYKKKKIIDKFLDQNFNENIELGYIKSHNNPLLRNIKALVGKVAGNQVKLEFNRKIYLHPGIEQKIEIIKEFRHGIAHGDCMPSDKVPNIPELRGAFDEIYKFVIREIINSLPKT
jgi:hypothetical protein